MSKSKQHYSVSIHSIVLQIMEEPIEASSPEEAFEIYRTRIAEGYKGGWEQQECQDLEPYVATDGPLELQWSGTLPRRCDRTSVRAH